MIVVEKTSTLPRTLAEFELWQPEDGYKYEWNDGELIKFIGMNKTQLYIFGRLSRLFGQRGYLNTGSLVAEQDVKLSGIQMRRPDIAYFTLEQEVQMKNGEDEIPDFMIEVISGNDNINQVEKKIIEYFKAGVSVLWLIIPEEKSVHVYTSRKTVTICTDNDICSASPVLPNFQISVNDLLG